MKRVGLGVCFLLVLYFSAAAAYGQTGSRVTGTVQDKSGAVVADAKVTLTNEATNVSVETTTTSTGAYVFDGMAPGTYTVTIVANNFSTYETKGNVLTIAQPMVVNAVLQVGQTSEKVEVFAGAELVQTENSGNLGSLVDQKILENLPIIGSRGRSPLDLLELQPGVVDGSGLNSSGFNIAGGGVSVNGSRDRAWNYTLDGIDINETSAGGSNFSPLRTNPDSIDGFRVITSNPEAEYGRSSGAQVVLETRKGSNQFHGNLFYFYQTPGLNANDPGNKNQDPPLDRPQFVQHIPGFSVGGPIFKDKTFFFVNTQFLHTHRTASVTSIVYTQNARNGLIRYVTNPANCGQPGFADCTGQNTAAGGDGATVDNNGNVLPGVTVGTYDVAANDPGDNGFSGLDPQVSSYIALTPLPNNFSAGDGLNTAGFTYLAGEEERQVDFTVRIDHRINAKNEIFGRWAHGHQNTIGDTANAGSAPFPDAPNVVDTRRQPRNLAISWRYTPNASVTNQVLVGMNRFIFDFANPDPNVLDNPPFFLNGDNSSIGNTFLTQPRQNLFGNKRALTTLQLVDNVSYIHGAHALKFGVNLRYQRHIDDRGSIGDLNAAPIVKFDTDTNTVDPTRFNLPNDINPVDNQTLIGGINNLLGRVGEIQQGLVQANANEFAPAGTHLRFDFRMPEYDFYAQDSWKIRPNLTIDLGLRWEIKLSPRDSAGQVLRPDQPFALGSAPSDSLAWARGALYRNAFHNFGPSVGFAWDPFNKGKTSVRGNYRLVYDRMNTFVLSSSVFQGLPGLTEQITDQSFGQAHGRLQQGLPVVMSPDTPAVLRQPPPFSVNAITTIDPNWTPPQVHQWSLSAQHQLGNNTVAEIAYIGHHSVHLFGGYDANQAKIRDNGFLDAFNMVAAGGDSPLIDQLLANDPARIESGETGSQFLVDGGPYSDDFSIGSVSAVAQTIGQRTDDAGVPLVISAGFTPFFFFNYPQFSNGFNVLDSNDVSSYHALQAQIHRNFSNGFTIQAAYTWSKSMDTRSFDPTFSTIVFGSSTFGASSTPFDNNNRKLNYAPSDFDRTHVFQSSWYYELPFGKDRRWGSNWNGAFERILGGWEVSGVFIWESGHPTTVYSPAFTTSNIVRAPASCTGCSHGMFSAHTDNGTINYLTPEQKDLFFTPGPGEFSNLGRNFFRLGQDAQLNLAVGKVTRIAWNQTLEIRLELQNATNSIHFDAPASIRIDSGSFGSLNAARLQNAGLAYGTFPRTMQLALKYRF
jgi:Carboxypeptidase regulatory-like domain/TonB-dependent Receptor Plug Domain